MGERGWELRGKVEWGKVICSAHFLSSESSKAHVIVIAPKLLERAVVVCTCNWY